MFRVLSAGLFTAVAMVLAGCGDKPLPTEVKSKQDEHGHIHERGKEKLTDIELPGGRYHAGLTAHLSKKEGNELDVFFETDDEKAPKPVPIPLTAKVTARVTREGDDTAHNLVFEPTPKDERKGDPDDKCSRFTAKVPWMKHEDKLTVVLTVEIDKQIKKCTFDNFNPKKYAHVDE